MYASASIAPLSCFTAGMLFCTLEVRDRVKFLDQVVQTQSAMQAATDVVVCGGEQSTPAGSVMHCRVVIVCRSHCSHSFAVQICRF